MAEVDAQRGIQALLQAEQEAAEVVARARKARTARVKQAAEEAQAEIRAYKAQREEQFKRYQDEHMGSTGEKSKQLDLETQQLIAKIKQDSSAHKNEVIHMLLNYVRLIQPRFRDRGATLTVQQVVDVDTDARPAAKK